ncbi:MAG: VOC family protein [Nocardioides sp.]
MKMLMNAEVREALGKPGLEDWRKLARALHARYLTGDFATGLKFVTAISEAAEAANHHPDLTLTYPLVDLKLLTHDAVYDGGETQRQLPWVTQKDLDLAATISGIARDLGIEADPSAVTGLELALDSAEMAAVGAFWAALLTGSTESFADGDVVDPSDRLPLLWFQETDAHETPRQRFHLDVWVPHDVADERIAAAVAAGGTVVDDSEAPSFTVLADAEGNRACVCSIGAR